MANSLCTIIISLREIINNFPTGNYNAISAQGALINKIAPDFTTCKSADADLLINWPVANLLIYLA